MLADVRYGSLADMAALFGDVRFTHGSDINQNTADVR
jgi:hypothetical protein